MIVRRRLRVALLALSFLLAGCCRIETGGGGSGETTLTLTAVGGAAGAAATGGLGGSTCSAVTDCSDAANDGAPCCLDGGVGTCQEATCAP